MRRAFTDYPYFFRQFYPIVSFSRRALIYVLLSRVRLISIQRSIASRDSPRSFYSIVRIYISTRTREHDPTVDRLCLSVTRLTGGRRKRNPRINADVACFSVILVSRRNTWMCLAIREQSLESLLGGNISRQEYSDSLK